MKFHFRLWGMRLKKMKKRNMKRALLVLVVDFPWEILKPFQREFIQLLVLKLLNTCNFREMPPSVIEANGASTTAMESTRRPETKTITPDDDDPSAIHIVRRSTGTKIRQMRSTLNRHGHGHDHHRRRRKGLVSCF